MEKVKRTPASLKNMVETFNMEILHKGRDFDNTVVTISDVNRPALQLVGFYDYFDDKRLQILLPWEIFRCRKSKVCGQLFRRLS